MGPPIWMACSSRSMASPTLRRCRSAPLRLPRQGREHDVRVVRVVVDEEREIRLARGGRIERGKSTGDRQIPLHRGECGLRVAQYLVVVTALARLEAAYMSRM